MPNSAPPIHDGASAKRSRRHQSFPGPWALDLGPQASAFGPAFLTPSSTSDSNFLKFSRNIPASFFACASYAALSLHVSRGDNTSPGTFLISAGTARPKSGSVVVFPFDKSPRSSAGTISRVYESFMRLPTPYGPPVQPVFTSHTSEPCWSMSLPNISAYFHGCQTRNTAPKHELNVACGSVTPRSVPATFAV